MTKDNETGLLVLSKQPIDSRLYDMDFSQKIRAGDSIQAVQSTAFTNMGKIAGSANITLEVASFSGSIVQVRIKDGQHLENYKITHRIITAPTGDVIEGDGLLLVRDK